VISSEVQRTLVKSPPELWAELGDPAALARHLGALGEIRITSAEPEKRVEWEAPGTSGIVQIKSSGWGTKVTLSVTREIELAEQPPATDSTAGAEPPAVLAEQAPASDSASCAEPPAVSSGTPEPGPEYTREPGPEYTREPGPEHTPEPGPEYTPEPESEDGVEVEVEAGSEPYDSAVTQAWPAVEAEPAAAAVEDEELAPETEIGGGAPDAWPEPPEEATEPRRGFFARLFGRRRPQVDPRSPDDLDPELDPTERSFEADADHATARAEDEAPQPAARSSAIESLQARFAPATAAAARAASSEPATAEAPAAVPETVMSGAPDADAEQALPDADAEQALPDADAEQAETAEPEAAEFEIAETEAAEPEAAEPVDLAAELKAAEEVAAEEVRAVLTAVLDRLGAAHHRPFSRS
jgi:hypothetical protein